MPADAVIILSTAGKEEGPSIAEALVTERCAACVNITGVNSFYCWKGELCRDREALMIIKTTSDRADAVMARIREMHSYELPEMIVIPVEGGYSPYLRWLYEETRP
jgi:periplasmic divalent cation tolerance protein